MAFTDVCIDEKERSNVQNESEHRFASYFILLNAQEQKFDDKFLLQIESLRTQGQYQGGGAHGKMSKNSRKLNFLKSLQTFHTWYGVFRDRLGDVVSPL